MSLKLSYRDKVIFIVVMVILVLVAGFFLFIKPKIQSVDVAKYNLETKQQEKADIDSKISTLPGIIQSIKDVATEIKEKQEIFLPEGHPFENENYVRAFLNELDIAIKSINTEYTVGSAISHYVVKDKNLIVYDNKMTADLYNELPEEVYNAYNKVAGESYPVAIIGVTSMEVTFASDIQFEDVYNVINRIAEDEKTIVLNTIEADGQKIDPEKGVEATAYLTLYSIYPLNVEKVMEETAEIKPLETQPAA